MTVKVESAAGVADVDTASVARIVASELKRNLMVSCAVDMIRTGPSRAPSARRNGVFDNRPV